MSSRSSLKERLLNARSQLGDRALLQEIWRAWFLLVHEATVAELQRERQDHTIRRSHAASVAQLLLGKSDTGRLSSLAFHTWRDEWRTSSAVRRMETSALPRSRDFLF